MISQENILSFLDILDLDEELIDARLKSIMNRDKYTKKLLDNAIQLLQYKKLVNLQDNTECDNDEEYEFAVKLIKEVDEENVETVCKIMSLTLGLNTTTLINRCEHLIQQLMQNIDLQNHISSISKDKNDFGEINHLNFLLMLKVIDSVLNAVVSIGQKLHLPYLDVPVKNILFSSHEQLRIHFLSSTVSKLFEAITGFHIFDSIWRDIKDLNGENRLITLKVLSSLSEYYLPIADSQGNVGFKSFLIHQYEFWNCIFYGLSSNDTLFRKISVYLAKRALDCVMAQKKDICVKSQNEILFKWDNSASTSLKIMWDNFFILMDSLEEKQSNIVLPSLQLFNSVKDVGVWLNCAFNIGLKHENTQVRFKCVLNRLGTILNSMPDATILLDALNDINMYDNNVEIEKLQQSLLSCIEEKHSYMYIFKAVPLIRWSPVPFYYFTKVLADKNLDTVLDLPYEEIVQTIISILKVPCNNKPIRKAVHINISHFIGQCCTKIHWKDYINIFLHLQLDFLHNEHKNPVLDHIFQNILIANDDKEKFFWCLLESYLHIDFSLLYVIYHQNDFTVYIDLLNEKLKKIDDVISRQYSDKAECLNEAIYLSQLFCKTLSKKFACMETINSIISVKVKSLIHYCLTLLSNNTVTSVQDMHLLSNGLSHISTNIDCLKELLQLYKTCLLFIKDKSVYLESCVLSLFIIDCLSTNQNLILNYKHEMISLKDMLELTTEFENKNSIGKLRNVFYEKSSAIVDGLLDREKDVEVPLKDILDYVETVIECGGYGCLRQCLKIFNKILPLILKNKEIKFDIGKFIGRLWNEIEELKSNNQYTPCIYEFINLITYDLLLETPIHNNIVIHYCKKIVDCGQLKTTALLYLTREINKKVLAEDHGHIVYVLCEILMYSPVPRKDQRIAENLVVEILQDPNYSLNQHEVDTNFNFQIQYESLLALSQINNPDILASIESFVMNRVNESFKNKQRYHGHSQAHRLLLTSLQHFLLILLLKPYNNGRARNWCLELLTKLPHQPSVRTCLEWYIALNLYIEKTVVDEDTIKMLDDIPLASQFIIIFWIVKHKILDGTCSNTEYEFVMDIFMAHTMGQTFNIRLHAQYLATKLHEIQSIESSRYTYMIEVIKKTFDESTKEKNFVKLQMDYFVNDFDVIKDLTPSFLYYFLPRYCEINNKEILDLTYVKDVINKVNVNVSANITNNDFHKEWKGSHRSDKEVFKINMSKHEESKIINDVEALGTIQKKYIPWKKMSDVNVYEPEKKRETKGDLIVVASLIDKLPNLGGMARTSEVFGVKTYIVDSLRHLQDKQFQGLSVSAERWVDIEEVRPGSLKHYLLRQKAAGYAVVAAEQTSSSCKLQAFRFPRKTLLLLGHEKEGIPCDLLPMMDYCVEIPQQGFVRSLNVHVTAAIFIWEYARQNILYEK